VGVLWSAVATTDPGTGARTAALAAVQALSTHGWTSSAPSPASDGTWTFTAHTGPDGAGTWTVVSAVDGPGTSGAGLLYRTVTPPPAAR